MGSTSVRRQPQNPRGVACDGQRADPNRSADLAAHIHVFCGGEALRARRGGRLPYYAFPNAAARPYPGDGLLAGPRMGARDMTAHPTPAADIVSGNELLTVHEAAVFLRTPVGTLRYWRHLGIGPLGFRIGKRVVYRREDLERWVITQRDGQADGRKNWSARQVVEP